MIGWDPWIKKSVNYLSCIEGKGVWKTSNGLQKMPRYLLIYYKYLLTGGNQGDCTMHTLLILGDIVFLFKWYIINLNYCIDFQKETLVTSDYPKYQYILLLSDFGWPKTSSRRFWECSLFMHLILSVLFSFKSLKYETCMYWYWNIFNN